MSSTEPSVFTRIVAREIPAEIVFESDSVLAIKDISPKAPVHLLVFPKTERYRDVTELASGDPALLAELVGVARDLAAQHTGGEFRLVFNTGESAGQTVFHVHAHVLGSPEARGHLSEGSLAQ
jgi:histidine triad (HIT) family protein